MTRTLVLVSLVLHVTCSVRSQYRHIEKVKISDNVYAFISGDPTRDYVDGNSAGILTDEGVFVVDAHDSPGPAADNIAMIKALTDRPVRYLLNTHWHYDHHMGNAVYRKEFPNVTIIAHAQTRRIMMTRVPGYVDRYLSTVPAQLDTLKAHFKNGVNDDGTHLTSYERTRTAQTISDLEKSLPEIDSMKFTPPTMTFDSRMTVFLGGEEIFLS